LAPVFSDGELDGLELQPDQQEQALSACYKEVYSGGQKPTRILLPVRNLQFWIDTNIVLALKEAPFDKKDLELVPAAGSCVNCSKRTGHNRLLFSDIGGKLDCCTDPACYQTKVDAHIAKTIAARPKLVQISTAYGQQKEGSTTLPRNKYTEIRSEKPTTKAETTRPEFKTCKYTADAIVSEGIDKGQLRKVCPEPTCRVHQPEQRPHKAVDDAKWKAEQERQRRAMAIAHATGLRILSAVGAAVPVRLLKRDLFFVLERLVSLLDENRIETLAKQHGIRQKRDDGPVAKTLIALARRPDEGTLSRIIVETTILLAASRHSGTNVLQEAAMLYKVDIDAITLKIKQEFAAKARVKKETKTIPKTTKAA
jgi:ParB family transcriptional regulator, chromosome partitioning protein